MHKASRRRWAVLVASMSFALGATWMGAKHASAQDLFRFGEWSDWGGTCRSPIERTGVARSRGISAGRLLAAGYTFGATFINSSGNSIPAPEGESIRALGLCYESEDNGGDSIELQTDFGEDLPSMVCPDDHPILGMEGSSVAVKCQIRAFLEL